MAAILPFFHRTVQGDWTQSELSEFYRVEAVLVQSGMAIVTDRGVSDEGEPWFVFCRQDNGEIIAHFARIGREYVIASSILQDVMKGRDFGGMVRQVLDQQPLLLPNSRRQNRKVFLHPAALLAAVVATAFEYTSTVNPDAAGAASEKQNTASWVRSEFAVLSAITMAVAWLSPMLDVLRDSADPSRQDAHLMTTAGYIAADTVPDPVVVADADQARGGLLDPEASLLVQDFTAWSPNLMSASAVALVSSQNAAPPESAAAASDTGKDVQDASVVDIDAPRELASMSVATAAEIRTEDGGLLRVGSGVTTVELAQAGVHHVDLSAFVRQAPSEALMTISQELHLTPQSLMTVARPVGSLTEVFGSIFADAAVPAIVDVTTAGLVSASLTPEQQAQEMLDRFFSSTSQFEVVVYGREVVVIDLDRSHYSDANFRVQTVEMTDGSTVSVLGIVPNDSHHAMA